jgi:hypothetical protein
VTADPPSSPPSVAAAEAPSLASSSGGPDSSRNPARVWLLGRAGCHLCDVARAAVVPVAAEAGAEVVEIDVDLDEELRRRYGDLVPVVLVDGVEVARYHVDTARLRVALR